LSDIQLWIKRNCEKASVYSFTKCCCCYIPNSKKIACANFFVIFFCDVLPVGVILECKFVLHFKLVFAADFLKSRLSLLLNYYMVCRSQTKKTC